jgi:hypothetical protein
VKRPRPAIEFLPPIIVHEKDDDDGASAILELPLHRPTREAVPELREAPLIESTLVLSGRRRARKWVPLNAAISLGVGAACLASALTAVTLRTRPPAPRVVEKIVTVPATPVATAPVAMVAPAPAAITPATAERGGEVPKPSETARTGAERGAKPEATRADASKADASKAAAAKAVALDADASKAEMTARGHDTARPDPSGLDSAETKPNLARREARAGFPTNPGF